MYSTISTGLNLVALKRNIHWTYLPYIGIYTVLYRLTSSIHVRQSTVVYQQLYYNRATAAPYIDRQILCISPINETVDP